MLTSQIYAIFSGAFNDHLNQSQARNLRTLISPNNYKELHQGVGKLIKFVK